MPSLAGELLSLAGGAIMCVYGCSVKGGSMKGFHEGGSMKGGFYEGGFHEEGCRERIPTIGQLAGGVHPPGMHSCDRKK